MRNFYHEVQCAGGRKTRGCLIRGGGLSDLLIESAVPLINHAPSVISSLIQSGVAKSLEQAPSALSNAGQEVGVRLANNIGKEIGKKSAERVNKLVTGKGNKQVTLNRLNKMIKSKSIQNRAEKLISGNGLRLSPY